MSNVSTLLITFTNVHNTVDNFFKNFYKKVGISGKKCIILKAQKMSGK